MATPKVSREERIRVFWSYFKIMPSGCLEWQRCVDHSNYGTFYFENKVQKTHRLSYLFTYGDFDRTLLVCHKCDNTKCGNPEHLFLGTHADNMRDMTAKGRHRSYQPTHCKNGHEFTSSNTHVDKKGHRNCRTCWREWARKARALKEASAV